jgi:hypothetical protein
VTDQAMQSVKSGQSETDRGGEGGIRESQPRHRAGHGDKNEKAQVKQEPDAGRACWSGP